MKVIIKKTDESIEIHNTDLTLGSEIDITTEEYNNIYSKSHIDPSTGMSTRTFDIDIISMENTLIELQQAEDAEKALENSIVLNNVSDSEISSFRAILEELMSDTPDASETSLMAATTAIYTQICIERNSITEGEYDGETTKST